MDPAAARNTRVLWSFWIACGLAVTGGLLPFLLAAGGTNRVAGAAIPFGVAAMAFAAAALLSDRGRPLATSLYFVAAIALVYGMLFMIAVPLRLAVVGICQPDPAICAPGLERPMSSGEDSGLAIGIAMGLLAILVGFFGLQSLYRMHAQVSPAPPVRRERAQRAAAAASPAQVEADAEPVPASDAAPSAPVGSDEPPVPIDSTETVTPEAATADVAVPVKPARKPRTKRTPPPPELAAPTEPLELSAPEEPLELPAPPAGGDADPAG